MSEANVWFTEDEEGRSRARVVSDTPVSPCVLGEESLPGHTACFLTTPTPSDQRVCVCVVRERERERERVGGGGARVFNKPLDMLNAKGRNLSEFLC